MKVWVTKYAFTKGIIPCEFVESGVAHGVAYGYATRSDTSIQVWVAGVAYGVACGDATRSDTSMRVWVKLGRDAFQQKADALDRAAKMRDKKIASLKKQIAKLEALTFEVQE